MHTRGYDNALARSRAHCPQCDCDWPALLSGVIWAHAERKRRTGEKDKEYGRKSFVLGRQVG